MVYKRWSFRIQPVTLVYSASEQSILLEEKWVSNQLFRVSIESTCVLFNSLVK